MDVGVCMFVCPCVRVNSFRVHVHTPIWCLAKHNRVSADAATVEMRGVCANVPKEMYGHTYTSEESRAEDMMCVRACVSARALNSRCKVLGL